MNGPTRTRDEAVFPTPCCGRRSTSACRPHRLGVRRPQPRVQLSVILFGQKPAATAGFAQTGRGRSRRRGPCTSRRGSSPAADNSASTPATELGADLGADRFVGGERDLEIERTDVHEVVVISTRCISDPLVVAVPRARWRNRSGAKSASRLVIEHAHTLRLNSAVTPASSSTRAPADRGLSPSRCRGGTCRRVPSSRRRGKERLTGTAQVADRAPRSAIIRRPRRGMNGRCRSKSPTTPCTSTPG